MIITFSGLDGTGKTTQAEAVAELLESKGSRCQLRHIIKSSLSYFFAHNVIGKVSAKAKSRVESGLRQGGGRFSFVVLAVVKKISLLTDIIIFDLVYITYIGNNHKVLICDRYFYDELVQAEYLGIAGRIFSRLYKTLIIKPDIAFILKALPEEAYSRKTEFDMQYFNTKSEIYDHMMKDNVFVLIRSDNIGDTTRHVAEYIEKFLGKK